MGIVEDLVGAPGLYLGIDNVQQRGLSGASRMVVTRLPGDVGVTIDYEVFNPAFPESPRGHVEHTVLARTHAGDVVMVIADTHAGALTILREGDPGVFEAPVGVTLPYPMKVVLSVPEPGRLRHSWWYGSPETGALEQDVSELALTR
jgi:hypothetical protein